MAPRHQAPRGTRHLLPEDLARWQWAEDRARAVCERYGYGEIRTPMFEDYELFARTSGESSDVVQKEMYRFQDLGERDLALRPEGTAGVCRAYLEHGLAGKGRLHRLWYMGPMFRYGRPQKGRYRQFHQIGAELIGSAAPGADVEIIALFVDLFAAWGFRDLTVALNSVGTPASRARYGDALRAWLAPARTELSDDSQRRLETNPLRVLDTKDADELALFAGGSLGPMPVMLDTIDAEDRAHFEAVCAGLDAMGIAYWRNHGLVRGLDYYIRTAFEVHDPSLGAQSALGGGGRYDGLIEQLGGRPTPGVGFSIGVDRALLVVEERGLAPKQSVPDIFVIAWNASVQPAAQALARDLRRAFTVVQDFGASDFVKQLKMADKSKARLAVFVGGDEWSDGFATVKVLSTGDQLVVRRQDIVTQLAQILATQDRPEDKQAPWRP
jgi:histidyl-tRNA synthetase